jgi:hypothetical protein
MRPVDYAAMLIMGAAAMIAAGAFSVIARYLFDRGLADRRAPTPDIRVFYRAYIAHTRTTTGRIGAALWVHGVSVALFIITGVSYTIVRWVLPRLV